MNYFKRCFAFGFTSIILSTIFSNAQVLVTGTLSGNNYNVKIGGNYAGINYPGHSFTFLALSSNTGASTLSINGGTPAPLVKNISQAIVAGDIKLNQAVPVIFDGINFQMTNQSNTTSAQWVTSTIAGAIFYSTGRVGIGNASPNAKLDIVSSENGINVSAINSASVIGVNISGGSPSLTYGIKSALSGGFPTYGIDMLATSSNTAYGGRFIATDSSPNLAIGLWASGKAQGGTSFGIYSEATGSGLNFGGYFRAVGGTSNYGLVVASGNVGIGTTTPGTTLDVNGNTRLNGLVTIAGLGIGTSIATLGINSLGGIVTVSGVSGPWISTTTGGLPSVYYTGTYVGLNMPPQIGATLIAKSSGSFDDVIRLYRPDGLFQVFRVRDNVTGGIVTAFDGSNNSRAQISADIGVPSFVLQLGIGTTNPLATLDVIGNARITGPVTVSSFAAGPSIAILGINSVGGITTVAGTSSQWISTGTGLIYYSNTVTDKVIIGVPYRINPFWKTSIIADDSPFLLSIENNNAIANTGAAATLTRTNGPWGARTPLLANDELGSLNFAGSSAVAQNISAASIRSVAEGAWSSTSGPSRLDIYTTNVNSTVPSLAMTIKSNGNIGIGYSLPQTRLDVNGNARFLGPVSISGFALGNAVYTLGVNSLGGIVTIAGFASNYWTVSGSNLMPINNYNISLASVSGAFLVGTNSGLRMNNAGSLFLGNNAGNNTVTGATNFVFGNGSGNSLSSGSGNLILGDASGNGLTTSQNNIFLGTNVGTTISSSNSNDNIMIGNSAGGAANSVNGRNVLIGYYTSRFINGEENVFVGPNTGELAIGSFNTGVGPGAGQNANGSQNVYLGFNAGQGTHSGSNNSVIGQSANIVGANINNSVALGSFATVGGSNMMALGGTGVNAVNVGIGTGVPAASLDVNGNARFLGPVTIAGFAGGSSVYVLGINSLGGIVTFSGSNINNYWTISGLNLTPISNVNVALVSTSGVFLIGTNAGLRMNDNNSIYIGNNTGTVSNTPANNVVIGKSAGAGMNTGGSNVLIGLGAGLILNNGFYNNMIGQGAGGANGTGSKNNFIGIAAGANNNGGGDNNFIGANAGLGNTAGSYNIAIGSNSNFLLPNLTNAIAIGQQASVGGSNMMVLGGVRGSGYELNVGLGTSTPAATLDVNGNARFLGPVTIAGFAGGSSVYTLGINSLGGIVTVAGLATTTTNYWTVTGTNLIPTSNYNIALTSTSGAFMVGTNTGLKMSNSGSLLLGNNAGNTTVTGATNFVYGNGSGNLLSSGSGNFIFGDASGTNLKDAVDNIFMGSQVAQQLNSNDNIIIGSQAGIIASSGNGRNVLLGYYSGRFLNGDQNVFLGSTSGEGAIGNTNVGIGAYAGQSANGNQNLYLGFGAGQGTHSGNNNSVIGQSANIVGANINNSVALGSFATVGGSNMMALGGTGVNAVNVGIGTGLPAATLDVNGNARFTGPVTISGFDTGNSVYTLGVNSLGGIVSVSGTSIATGFSGYTSTDVTLGISTTQISFDSENYDKASALSGSTYVVPVAGEYLFTVSATTNNIGEVDLLLLKNGSVVKEVRISPSANSGVYNTAQLTAFLDLNLNDSISVIIRQYTGTPQTLFSLSGTGTTFSGKKLF